MIWYNTTILNLIDYNFNKLMDAFNTDGIYINYLYDNHTATKMKLTFTFDFGYNHNKVIIIRSYVE